MVGADIVVNPGRIEGVVNKFLTGVVTEFCFTE